MSTLRDASTPRSQPAELFTLTESDLADVVRLIATQSGRSPESVDAHLRWFWLENPAREPKDPLGFGLRSADQLVGCILCCPQAFCFEKKRIVLMGSSSFYVDERYRGHGGRIFLQYARLSKQQPLFGTSANAEAAALWKAAGARPISGSDGELLGVLRWPPVVEEFVQRRYSSHLLSRLAGSPISTLAGFFRPLKIDCAASDALQLLTSPEQANDLLVHDRSAKLTAMRDLPYIRWRYFSGRDTTVAVFAFRSRLPDRDILVTLNRRARGYRNQINTLNLLDVYPEVPLEEWLKIIGALIARYRKIVDAVVLRYQSPAQRNLFCEAGFRWRAFDAPTGWFLDKTHRLPPDDWYFVPADGDGLI
jgi:hypothetical protein